MEYARAGIMTQEMKAAAQAEGIEPEYIMKGIACGEIALPRNIRRKPFNYRAVGKGLSTKVNANIGTSDAYPDIEQELYKLKAAIDAGAHSVMDLSTGGDINESRRRIIDESEVMVGTVPLYQAMVDAATSGKSFVDLCPDDFFDAIESHCKDGADFITVHCGITRGCIDELKSLGRIMDIVSRGGSFLTAWMLHNEKENPLFEQFDRLLEIAREFDATLSLGDGLRPGCIADATDAPQIKELIILGGLVKRAREAGVQTIVEGPGHVPLHQIKTNMELEKTLCFNAPFYVLGPIVTDIAPGYDHITSAIGGALAAWYGADFLCYVTPAEHLGLPSAQDVKDGVIASRIAAHAADIAKGVKRAKTWDLEMAKARKALDWEKQIELAIDPIKARCIRTQRNDDSQKACTMCGEYCAYRIVSKHLGATGKQTASK
jgi:phosphomethylpyrimidine synthase